MGKPSKSFTHQVGRLVQIARWARGMTQDEAAAKIGLSGRYLGQVERGEANIRLSALQDIARALDVTVADLVDVDPRHRAKLSELDVKAPPRGRKPKPKKRAHR